MAEYRTSIRGPLTYELKDVHSPVRGFIEARFGAGLPALERRYREGAPALVVPGGSANPGTIGTAADWQLRFQVHNAPHLHLAVMGALLCCKGRIELLPALAEIAAELGTSLPPRDQPLSHSFTGPVGGNQTEPVVLARACWVLAVLAEAYRGGAPVILKGPLAQFAGRRVSGADLLGLASQDGVDQLLRFRSVFETGLIPRLAAWPGLWAIGPVFAGSALMNADADLIAGGLLVDLKTHKARPSLSLIDAFQLVGYALLDFEDEHGLREVGLFDARYGYLTTWALREYLGELAGRDVDLPAVREEFRSLVLACSPAGTQR